MIYILIIAMHVNSGSQMHSVEFNTKQACLVAAEEIKRQRGGYVDVIACVQKGQK